MSTLTRTIAHAEAECKQMHSPNRKRHQTSSSPMQIQGTEQGEDPNNNNHDHHDSVTKVHSTSMCPAESNITSAPTSQNSQTFVSSRTHFNVLNVSTNSTPKVLRPAPPPPNSSPPTQTRTTSKDIPNLTSGITVKRIKSSVSGSVDAVPEPRVPESMLEKLSEIENEIDNFDVTHLRFQPEDSVDDDEEEEKFQNSCAEQVRLKVTRISNANPKILSESGDSSSEDLLESQDDEEEGEERKDDEIVDDSSIVNTFNTAHKNDAPPIPAEKGPDLEERLRISQPIWYLPNINRATVVHYLQGKNVGVFIIRQSSKPQTLAISVRLPHGRGPHVEHYLIEKRNTSKCNCLYRLEGSEHYFTTILNLVVHYSNCCDELPVRLALPPVLRTSTSGRNQLTSLALLGQEFWQSKFVQLKQLPRNSLNNETLALVSSSHVVEPKVSDEPKPRLPPRRHNLNCSSNTSLSSSSSQSHSTASPVLIPKKKLGIEPQAEVITRNRSPITKSSPPPPLPPKNPDSVSPCSELSRILEFPEKVLGESLATKETTPKLPPRQLELPPPIPPRNKDNSCFKGSQNNISPPPRPTANKRSSPSIQVVQLNDLLSPMSMTESEIDEILNKHKVPLSPRLPLPLPSSLEAAKANYYNHLASSNSGKLSPPQPKPSQQSISIISSSQIKTSSPELTSSYATEQSQIENSDVYTQTEVPKHPPPPKPRETPPARPNSNLSDSTYYMDPIDALVVINGVRNSLCLEPNKMLPQKRNYSDPELASQKKLQDTYTRFAGSNHKNSLGNSLESLLDSFRNRYPTASTINDTKKECSQNDSSQNDKTISTIPEISENADGGRIRFSIKPDAGFSTVDSMWQWHDCARQSSDGVCAERCKQQKQQPDVPSHNKKRASIADSIQSDVTTVEDMMSIHAPELVVPKVTLVSDSEISQSLTNGNGTGMYDNLSKEELAELTMMNGGSFRSTRTDGTDFSEPWNMDMVESRILSEFGNAASGSSIEECELESCDSVSLDATAHLLNNDLIHFNSYLLDKESDKPSHYSLDQDYDNVAEDEDYDEYHPMNGTGQHNYPMKRDDSEVTLTNVDVNGNNSTDDANSPQNIMLDIVNNISSYVFELAERKDDTFAKSIHNFIECTKEGTETSPNVILGYIRQFMNGMKNYLIKHGEGEFLCIVKRERSRLKPHQFLNIDSILECALQKLIIAPLKNYIYEICIRAYNSSGTLKILSHNIKLAQKASPEELGIKVEMLPIEATVMVEIQHNLRRLQQSYSPIKKLEHLLRVFGLIKQHLRQKSKQNGGPSTKPVYCRSLSGSDMAAMLLYTIVQCGLVSVQIEMEYMLGLLHSSILNTGDATYYLNVASWAIQQLLTNMYDGGSTALEHVPSTASVNGCVMSASLVLSILIPNELTSSIGCKQVPVRPNMSAKEVCRMIAHTHRITNPEHYALYRIKDLQDHALADADLPQMIKHQMMQRGEPMPIFAYKRCDANFIWPTVLPSSP